jgi:hypothetical protein
MLNKSLWICHYHEAGNPLNQAMRPDQFCHYKFHGLFETGGVQLDRDGFDEILTGK